MHTTLRIFCIAALFACPVEFLSHAQQPPDVSVPGEKLAITRSARPWEFLATVGRKASLLGNESGVVEAWVYPLKILRDLRLTIHTEGREIPAETLVRTVIAHPESVTLVYAGNTFSISETFFAPVNEPGAVIEMQVETERPLEIEASFIRDFQLEWPASMGGTYIAWSDPLRAFLFGEDREKFAAIAGSPTAASPQVEYETNYGGTRRSSMRLGVTNRGRDTKLMVVAGSINGRSEAETAYNRLTANYQSLLRESAQFYRDYLARTVRVEVPDEDLERAYDWSRVSLMQGLVSNPTMGDGLIAGYRASGESYRPGFAWFFGRDSLWCDLALASEGDFATSKTALEFIAKFQRQDGKIPHEIAQGASFVDWFKAYPYAYASADATPLYIIGVDDYVTQSGDVEFAATNWTHIQKAYEFLRSSYNANGLPRNFGIGHGWVEGGPLLPIESEFYQSGLAAAAIRSLAHLSQLTGKEAEAKALSAQFDQEHKRLNEAFWSAEKGIYAFAQGRDNGRVDEASVLATVPMWFGLTDEDKSQRMISALAAHEHQTDWGMRIISSRAAKFSGGGYHYGSVWPLFTGWASVAEYRYHRELPAYENLRANALLALDGSPGHVTEVLSGDYYQPLSTSSPHQIWSAAMVISPLLRGAFGLKTDAIRRILTFAPHTAGMPWFSIDNLPVGKDTLSLAYRKEMLTADAQFPGGILLEVKRTSGSDDCEIDFRPAISPRTTVQKVELNGKVVPFQMESHGTDQHVVVQIPVKQAKNVLRVWLAKDFGIDVHTALPPLGSPSRGLRILSETWSESRDQLELNVSGLAGSHYSIRLEGSSDEIRSVEGATPDRQPSEYKFAMPADQTEPYAQKTIVIHFRSSQRKR